MLNFNSLSINTDWREIVIRTVLVAFCAGLWFGLLYAVLVPLLIMAWLLDGGLKRWRSLIAQPLVVVTGVFCLLLLLGLCWSETVLEGRHKWAKYLLLLTYIPFFGLLNASRLPWVVAATSVGYGLVLLVGLHAWFVEQQQGIPQLNMSYLTASALLGVGSVVLCCGACLSRKKSLQALLVTLALVLLYLQFQQSARGFLLATVMTLMILFVQYYQVSLRVVLATSGVLLGVVVLFGAISPVLSERWWQAGQDFGHIQQGHYDNSIGYRLALWDVGLHGIAEKPLLGHGTGMPERYFDRTVVHYKDGLYADLPAFQTTSHYHNDWIEIGMHLGLLGITAYAYLLFVWYRTFKRCGLDLPATAMVSFVLLSGLTETFLIFARMPVLLLVITAIAVCRMNSEFQQQQPEPKPYS